MNYYLTINIAHCKIISKALHLLKMIYKGDLSFVISLLYENTQTILDHHSDYIEKTSYAQDELNFIEQKYIQKFVSILLMGERGFNLSAVKKKFIDAGVTIKLKHYEKYDIVLSENEIQIVIDACQLYYQLQCGKFSLIYDKFSEVKKYPDSLLIELESLECQWYNLNVTDIFINRKSKWCYDISETLIHKEPSKRLIGTLPRIKIRDEKIQT